MVKYVTIDEASDKQRLDNFLFKQMPDIPRSRVYRAIRGGEVRVNKGRAKQTTRLSIGDVVRIPPLMAPERRAPQQASQQLQQFLQGRILYENPDFLVINKPSGLPVHGGTGQDLGVIDALRQMRPQAKFLELVHRLDKGTSGCLVIAKKRVALLELQKIWSQGVQKEYLTLLKGRWQGGTRTVKLALKKNTLDSGERRVSVDKDGKSAFSIFKPERQFAKATLMRVELKTGRTHQIRVHAFALRHPVAGDDKYGDKAFNRTMKQLGLKRLFLHAAELRLTWEGEKLAIDAPLDEELQSVVAAL